MSLASNRIALAPIKDSHLNVNSPRNTTKKQIPLTPNYRKRSPVKTSISLASDFKTSRSTSPKNVKNGTVGLAATKLKLKLQLALYKLQQKQPTAQQEEYAEKSLTPPLLSSLSFQSTQLPTPPNLNYSSSININLKTKTKISNTMDSYKPSLSKIAFNKQINNKKIKKLKLFHIKKNSIFNSHFQNHKHSSNNNQRSPIQYRKSLPLIINEIKLPKPIINQSFTRNTRLPSINKILKTPIKNSASTRILVNNNTDDTIDEDDTTILNVNSATTSKKSNNTNTNNTTDNNNILSSSPISNNFGTPNSFSVAKSLLQLGGYSM